MKVLVLGGAGMLGHQMVKSLRMAHPDTWWTLRGRVDDPALEPAPWLRGPNALQETDAADLDRLEGDVRDLRPDLVVNCLGVIKQRTQADDPVLSITINSLLPHRLCAALREWGGRFLHFSTDCVFSGRRGEYSEADMPDPEDLYGRTKLLGEVQYENALTLRTSIIGRELRHHKSLLDWFLSQRGRTIRGFRRHWWSGVTTNHLAEVAVRVANDWPSLHGLFQISSGKISKYDLLCRLREGLGVDVQIEPDDTTACDRSLSGEQFTQTTGYTIPSWSTMIAQLAADRTPYPKLAT